MTTRLDISNRARVLVGVAAALILGGLTAALVLSGCARNEAGATEQRGTSAVPPRQVPAPAEPAAAGTEAAKATAPLPTPAIAPVRPSLSPPALKTTTTAKSAAAPVPGGRGETEAFPRPESVPLTPMGDVIGFSPVTKSPGYYPGDDPEADAVRTGRRKAPLTDVPFQGGMKSPEDLAVYILDALRRRDSRSLQSVRVTLSEFSEIMWPEFPQSRPYCNSTAEFAYTFMERTSYQGVKLGLSDWGGQDLRLEGVAYPGGRSPYTNFALYNGVELHVSAADGRPGVIRFAECFAERKGVWKVYTYKDKE
jgi:hypothetical protein